MTEYSMYENLQSQDMWRFSKESIKFQLKHYLIYVSTNILLYEATCFDVLNGHLQAFLQTESTDAVYMLGSQYVYIDKIHKIRQFGYLGRSDICIA